VAAYRFKVAVIAANLISIYRSLHDNTVAVEPCCSQDVKFDGEHRLHGDWLPPQEQPYDAATGSAYVPRRILLATNQHVGLAALVARGCRHLLGYGWGLGAVQACLK
jgi:hypothetical protein